MIVAHRRAQRRGSLATCLVLVMGTVLAAVVMGSAARVDPAAREARRTWPSDQAWAAAEGGVALAEARLRRDRDYAGVEALTLGPAQVEIEVVAAGPGLRDVSVVARVQDPAGRPGEQLQRRVMAQLALTAAGEVRVIDWEDL